MAITQFQGQYRFLSNFWPAEVKLDGEIYSSVEHAYQAAKTLDPSIRKQFQRFILDPKIFAITPSTITAADAKRLSHTFEKRSDWHQVKLLIMEDLVRQKFQHPTLKASLLATGDEELIEGNDWNDFFYGVCNGVGENHLGKILMKIRHELQNI